jgi:hypothetical protein
MVPACPDKKQDPSQKITKAKRGMARAVEHISRKHGAESKSQYYQKKKKTGAKLNSTNKARLHP